MKKFFVLLKKEVSELLTLETILPLIITVVLFAFIGNVIGKEQKKSVTIKQNIVVVDRDNSQISSIIKTTVSKTLNVEEENGKDINSIVAEARDSNKSLVMIIPEGFERSVLQLNPEKIEIHSIIRNFSFMGSKSYEQITASLTAVNEALSNQLIAKNISGNPDKIKNPLSTDDFVAIGEKTANINPIQVLTFISSQTTFIPIILFVVIVMASQMIATAIATEKENKTLETLLTTPVNRKYIVTAKMAGAGIVALLSALIYMFGFKYYMDGVSGSSVSQASADMINKLGLSFTPGSYVILGVSLFFGILAALSISLILGAFAEDAKSVAGLTTPLMILVTIPYILSLFLDINSLPTIAKYLIYAIPFTHSFLAAPNLLLGNYMPIIWGILYQFIFFAVFVVIAAKIFSSDKIMTMKLNFSKKKK